MWIVNVVKKKLFIKYVVPLILIVVLLIILLFVGMYQAAIETFAGDSESSSGVTSTQGISSDVLQWQPLIEKEMKAQDVDMGYLNLVLALIMQESGGRPPDIMQSSESIGLPVNSLQPPDSIHYGIAHFKASLEKAGVKNPQDMDGIKLMLQSYNFGTGFIDYAKKHGGKYTKELAISFSQMQAVKLGWPSYGDTEYVEHVLRYLVLDDGSTTVSAGDYVSEKAKKAVGIALKQQGKPYIWGAVGPNEFDCSGLVIYSYQQAGVSISGRPTTKTMYAGNGNFKPVSRENLKAGDLVIIAFGSQVDHIGIYIGQGKMVHAATDQAPLNKQIYTAQIFGDNYWEAHIRGYRRVQ
ncbi:C40 family peptidase [Listeria innocua]|uniref:bifunctional lytic transglycosylase/C40 family peptidase n=1 Tax=Listeria innocua TaxID=1642 RepID=UPI001629A129|nr:bifunctional lytic transglycosylase/C40 family peptidase [Listeria innocua]MBC1903369.1 C40 family peptidase [Listeria innocua]